jgi:hypothetical protein
MGNKIKHGKGKGIQKDREGTFKNIEEKKKKDQKRNKIRDSEK